MTDNASNQETNNTTTTNTSYAKIQEVLQDVTNQKAAAKTKAEFADKPSELSLIAQLYQKVDDLNKELTQVKTELNNAKGVIAETATGYQEVVQVINLLLMKAKKEMEVAAATPDDPNDAPPPGMYM